MDLMKALTENAKKDQERRNRDKRKRRSKQPTKKGVSPRGRRIKGHNFEREIVHFFRGIYNDSEGKYIKRGLQTRSGSDGADVETPDFWVECKFHSREPNIRKALEQAMLARPYYDSRFVCSITKSNNNSPIFSMYLDDAFKFLEEFKGFDNIGEIEQARNEKEKT